MAFKSTCLLVPTGENKKPACMYDTHTTANETNKHEPGTPPTEQKLRVFRLACLAMPSINVSAFGRVKGHFPPLKLLLLTEQMLSYFFLSRLPLQ